ncbi:MAG: biotin transporter BioY [Candidatus Adiutrix sp.]|jgi:biotin transport system substrate-specific component|nr:biotin transporter BioY [Candidatus Adiutrix sp.]
MTEDRAVPAASEPAPTLAEIRFLVRLVLWSALIGAGAWLSIPLPGVPISLQSFFVILAGLVAGPRVGALAAGLYLLAGLLGLPVFAGGLSGPSILLRPSAGYALAFPLTAAAAGLAVRREPARRPGFGRAFLGALAATFLLHLCGFVGFCLNTGQAPLIVAKSLSVFIPGDLAKCAAAASLASAPHLSRLWPAGRL